MIEVIKNLLRTKKIYWKYRHILNSEVWETYYKNSYDKRRNFYSKYVYQNNLNTIFEFGCASGPNLFNIYKNIEWDINYFGYDISNEAIKFANNKLKKRTHFFTNKLNKESLNYKLNKWGKKKFDLSIYDRVLYLLSEKEIKEHFSEYKDYFSKLIIDDFHNSKFEDRNESYFSKNYEIILLSIGFKLIKNEASEHLIGNDNFYQRSARRLIFEKM